jgi:hypothetical protein
MHRYQWTTVCARPAHHQLVDSVTAKPVVNIRESIDGWQWVRKTNFLLHGAHPASGVAETLIRAKIAAIQGLPFED